MRCDLRDTMMVSDVCGPAWFNLFTALPALALDVEMSLLGLQHILQLASSTMHHMTWYTATQHCSQRINFTVCCTLGLLNAEDRNCKKKPKCCCHSFCLKKPTTKLSSHTLPSLWLGLMLSDHNWAPPACAGTELVYASFIKVDAPRLIYNRKCANHQADDQCKTEDNELHSRNAQSDTQYQAPLENCRFGFEGF